MATAIDQRYGEPRSSSRSEGSHAAPMMTLRDLLRDGLFIDGDWVESKDQNPDGEVRLIQLSDIGDGIFLNKSNRHLTKKKALELRCTFLRSNDVLVARMPEPLGRACLFPLDDQEYVTAVDVCILRPNRSLCRPKWLMYAINSPQFRAAARDFERGTTRKRISRANLGLLEIPVPKIIDQDDMIGLINELLAKVRSARERLAHCSGILDRFRKSVLAAACSGRLTIDWRDRNNSEESGHQLAVRITGHLMRNQSDVGKHEEIASWAESSIGDLCEVATGATPLRTRSDYYDGGKIPWITSSAVNQSTVTLANEYITDLAIKETNAKVFPAGTLIVAMYGEGQTRGRVAELGIATATNQALAAMLFDEVTAVSRPFLKLFLLKNYEDMRSLAAGGVQPNLSLGLIKQMRIPVPPLEEQAEIVRRVEALFNLADRVESLIGVAAAQLERTTQSILAKAFRGELT